jgi:tRNA G18 (ribose-2'-O)-methylase SpoU
MERVPYLATAASASYTGLRLPVSILLDNVRSMYNVGSFFRTADGAGVERLLLSGITGRPPQNAIRKTALGADERVAWQGIGDPVAAVQDLRLHGYEIAAIETSTRAVDIRLAPALSRLRSVRPRSGWPFRRSARIVRHAR